jgi:hypothetical protein
MFRFEFDKIYSEQRHEIVSNTKKGSYYFSLKGCKTRDEFIARIGLNLHGERSPVWEYDNLDALNDVLGDWIYDRRHLKTDYFENSKWIYIDHFHELVNFDCYLAMKIVDIFNSALHSSLYNMLRIGPEKNSDIVEELSTINVVAICID